MLKYNVSKFSYYLVDLDDNSNMANDINTKYHKDAAYAGDAIRYMDTFSDKNLAFCMIGYFYRDGDTIKQRVASVDFNPRSGQRT